MDKTQKNTKKYLYYFAYFSVLVIFLMHLIFCVFPVMESDQTLAAWSIPISRPGGMMYSGSTDYASTPQEFLYAINSSSTRNIELTENIDFSGNTYPIIKRNNSLTINGKGHTITGISYSSSNSCFGLISSTTSSVTFENLHLILDIDYSASKKSQIGGFVGNASGSVNLMNCTVSGNINVSSSKDHDVGGFVGYSSSTIRINNSINYTDISTIGATRVGGLIGNANSTSTSLSVCANFGDIRGATGYIGGLIGYSRGSSSLFTNFNSGNITGTTGSIGGLVGYNSNRVSFSSCYNTGNINSSSSNTRRGGIVGFADTSQSFNYCYSVVSLTSTYALDSQNVSRTVTPTHECDSKKLAAYSITNSENAIMSTPYGGGDGGPVNVYVRLKSVDFNVLTIADLCSTSYSSTNSYCYSTPSTNDSSRITLTFQVWVDGQNKGTLTHSIEKGDNEKYHWSNINLELEYYYILGEAINNGKLSQCTFKGDPLTMSGDGFILNSNGYVKMSGLQLNYSNNSLRINSLLEYKGWISNSNDAFYSGGGLRPGVVQEGRNYYYINEITDKNMSTQIVSINNTTKNIGNSIHLTNKTDIKNKSMGSSYITDSSINSGYPFLKDFYWIYE